MMSGITAWEFDGRDTPTIRRPMEICSLIEDNECSALNDYLIVALSKVIKGGMVVGGCRGSVAEHWRLKPEALDSNPGSTTLLFFPLPFQRSSKVTAQIVFD